MKPVFDNRPNLIGKPACHAFVVGVSDYPHLVGGTAQPARETFERTQLSSPAPSAARLAEWLIDHQSRLPVPLGTCRVLCSTSPELLVHNEPVARATVENFVRAATEWAADAGAHRDGIALFYFAGHGFELSQTDQVMLLEDFGNGIGPLLRGGVGVTNLFYGMAPSGNAPEIARTQAFFVDMGRTHQPSLQRFERTNTTAVFDANPSAVDDRSAGIFYASSSGSEAYAAVGKPTLFNQSLISCFEGGAATAIGETNEGNELWGITLFSLAEALPKQVNELSRSFDIDQRVSVGGSLGPAILFYMDGPPLVDVSIQLEPAEAVADAHVTISNGEQEVVANVAPPMPQPFQITLPAGLYSVNVSSQSAGPSQPLMRFAAARPPRSIWRFRII
jgi:hypothetical protein